jgi:hypothetical protein
MLFKPFIVLISVQAWLIKINIENSDGELTVQFL